MNFKLRSQKQTPLEQRAVALARPKDKLTLEGKINNFLGNPKEKAIESVRRHDDEMSETVTNFKDSSRHLAAGLETGNAVRNLMPKPLGNSVIGRVLGAGASNILGAAHEIKGIVPQIKEGKGVVNTLQEAGEDLINNFAGSMIGMFGDSNPGTSNDKIIDKALKYLPDGEVLEGKVGNRNNANKVKKFINNNRQFKKNKKGTN